MDAIDPSIHCTLLVDQHVLNLLLRVFYCSFTTFCHVKNFFPSAHFYMDDLSSPEHSSPPPQHSSVMLTQRHTRSQPGQWNTVEGLPHSVKSLHMTARAQTIKAPSTEHISITVITSTRLLMSPPITAERDSAASGPRRSSAHSLPRCLTASAAALSQAAVRPRIYNQCVCG